jgi:hypothetical protein
MARDEHAKQTGVTVEAVKACLARNRDERKANLAAACGAFDKPSIGLVEQTVRLRGRDIVNAALRCIEGRKFESQSAADSAFTHAIGNVALRPKYNKAAA